MEITINNRSPGTITNPSAVVEFQNTDITELLGDFVEYQDVTIKDFSLAGIVGGKLNVVFSSLGEPDLPDTVIFRNTQLHLVLYVRTDDPANVADGDVTVDVDWDEAGPVAKTITLG